MLFFLDEETGSQVFKQGALDLGIKGKVKTFEGLLFFKRGTGQSLGKFFGLPSLYLILDHVLEEGEVIEFFLPGLLEPEIQGFNESSKTEGFQLVGKVMFYVHGCTS